MLPTGPAIGYSSTVRKSQRHDYGVWILTFNRPTQLNRLIQQLGNEGFRVNVFSNYPSVQLLKSNQGYIDDVVVNTLTTPESNSWCARSWNSIYLKAFERSDTCIFFQDDTSIYPGFGPWIDNQSGNFDFIWGPGGDQWWMQRLSVLQRVGWWDERYLGCYCGDADYLKRVYQTCDQMRVSVEEFHNWGFVHNPCGIKQHINTEYNAKVIDNYQNQHWDFEARGMNDVILHSQAHYKAKWGVDLDINQPLINYKQRLMPEIDWYPWFSKKHSVNTHNRKS